MKSGQIWPALQALDEMALKGISFRSTIPQFTE